MLKSIIVREVANHKLYEVCIGALRKTYGTDMPSDKDGIIKAIELCINTLINNFEEEVLTYTNPLDTWEIIEAYSGLDNSHVDNEIIFKNMCRYFISLVPQIKYDPNTAKQITGEWDISNLFLIARESQRLLQLREFQIFSEKKILQLEIIDETVFDFTFINKEDYELFSSFPKDCIWKMSLNINRMVDFQQKLQDSFGGIVDSFSRIIIPSNEAKPNTVVDLTSLVKGNIDCDFIKGLLFRRENSSLKNALYSPYDSKYRPRFRPIIELNFVDCHQEYITTGRLCNEAMDEIYNNMIPFGDMPIEWKQNNDFKTFVTRIQNVHGSWLENTIEKIILGKYDYLRNKKAINNISLMKQVNGGRPAGEMDFVILSPKTKTIFVADAKMSKTKYYFSGYDTDRKHYMEQYSKKLSDKVSWASNHISDIGAEMKMDLLSYNVKGFFITETFTLYSLISNYPIIPYRYLLKYLESEDRYCYNRP